jgi:biotin carboxylase
MKRVVFAAPFLMDTTARFVRSVAETRGVRLGLVTQEPLEKVPDTFRGRLAGHWKADDLLDPDALERAVRGVAEQMGGVDLLVGTLEQLQVPLAEVRERLDLPGMRTEAARNFRDKARMKDVLRAHGLPCARHRLAATPEDARRFAAEIGYPLVMKPPAGAGGKATYRLERADDLEVALRAHTPAPGREALLEEFIVGQEHSLDTVSVRGTALWHSLTIYEPTPLHVLETPWIQWCVLLPREVDHPRYDDIRHTGARALEALGMGTGVSHMEWFRRRDGSVAISEVGARPPGAQFCTLISLAHDVDFYRLWARLVVHEQFSPPRRAYAAGGAYLRGQGSGRVTAVRGLDEVQKELGPLVAEVRLPQPGQSPTGSYEGEGYILLRHPETEVVARGLERIVSLVRVDLG